jgi:hypothetical protein
MGTNGKVILKTICAHPGSIHSSFHSNFKEFSKFNLQRNLFGKGTLHERSKNERQPYSIVMSVYEKEVFWSHLL